MKSSLTGQTKPTAASDSALVETRALARDVQLAEAQFEQAALDTFLVVCLAAGAIFFSYWLIDLLDNRQAYNSVYHLLIAVLFALFGLRVYQTRQLNKWHKYLASWIFIPLFGALVWVNGILPLTHLSVYIVFTYIISDLKNARITSALQLLLAMLLAVYGRQVEIELLERLIIAGCVTILLMELFLRGVRRAFRVLQSAASKLEQINSKLNAEYRDKEAVLLAAHKAQVEKATAEVANASMRQFVANMSHELRTPLNAISGMNQLLASSELDARQRGYLDTARVSAQHLLDLINQVLDFSKIQSGKLQLDIAAFCLHDVLAVAEATLVTALEDKPVSYSIDIDPAIADAVLGDELRLRQVLLNLVSNAAKFTPAGKISVAVRLLDNSLANNNLANNNPVADSGENDHLAGQPPGMRLEFSVTDTGVGIEPADQQLIFNPFSQADATTTRQYGGTGLGLSISRELIGLMGGELRVQSQPHKGSCFTFAITLALQPAQQQTTQLALAFAQLQRAAAIAEPPAASDASLPLARIQVLLVDDNRTNQVIAEELLKLKGATVEIATDGQQAINKVLHAHSAYDVVLMDIQMPHMDGYQATRILREEHGLLELPILAMTANALPADVAASRAAGMIDHIVKPIEVESLVEKILRHTARRI